MDNNRSKPSKDTKVTQTESSRNSRNTSPPRRENVNLVEDSTSIANLDEILNPIDSSGYSGYPGTERIDYDFTAERYNMTATNIIESTAHLIKGCLGAGFLNMHVAFMYGGIWTSLVITVIVGLIVSHSMMTLVKSAHKMYNRLRIPRLSYADLAEASLATGPWACGRRFSKVFRYTVEICLFVELCGTCCIFQMIMATTVKKILESIYPSINMSIRSYILCITVPLILICLIRSLKYLAPFSLVADLFIGFCVIVTMYYSLTSGSKLSDRPAWKSVHGAFKLHGISLYAIDGVAIALPVENNMKKPKYFSVVLQYGMSFVVVTCAATGFFGYLGWGEECKSPFTIHMPGKTFPLTLQFLIVTMITTTFAVHLWVPFKIIWSYISRRHKRKRGYWERFYKVLHVFIITTFSVLFPNVVGFIVVMGNFFLAYISFVFPALIECLIIWKDPCGKMKSFLFTKNLLMMVFGLLVSVGVFYSVIRSSTNKLREEGSQDMLH